MRTSDDRRYRLINVLAPPPAARTVGLAAVLPLASPLDRRACVTCWPFTSPRRCATCAGWSSVSDAVSWGSASISPGKTRSVSWRGPSTAWPTRSRPCSRPNAGLLQDVSHELRSPLARLGFAVELAKTSNDREAALTRIRKEADRLNQLVDELLQLTRAEGDPAARNMEEIELAELLEDLVADCRCRGRSARMPAGLANRSECHLDRRPRAAAPRLRKRAAQRDPARPRGEPCRGCAVGATTAWRRSPSATTARAFRRRPSPRSSSRSTVSKKPGTAPAAAWGWAWRSPAGPSSCTKDG